MTKRCTDLRVVLVASVLAASGVGELGAQCPDGSPPPCAAVTRRAAARAAVAPPEVAARRRSFLVLPFRNLTRAPEHDWLVEGSPVLIADALSRLDSLKVVPDERLYPALERAGLEAGSVMDLARVRRVAEETGGWTAVTGEIMSLGNRLRVSARAFDVVSNAEVMRAVEEAQSGDDVRAIYDRLSTRLMTATGVGGAAANLANTTTKSVEAYRHYVRGVSHENRSEVRQARDAFREAVRLDSTFAQAYARLAETEMNVDPRQISNIQSPLYRYSARAAALATNLPPHHREVVLTMHEFLSGRFGAARERITRLVAADSLNVDALERLATIEMFDPILVDRNGAQRPRGSLNRALALAKRVLELDPSRHQLYGSLVQSYLLAAGLAPGYLLGYAEEAPSLPALLTRQPAMTFVPLLRDTIVLVPIDSLNQVPTDTVAAARARAVDAARQWVTRWLAAGKGQAEPHLWASRVHSQAGNWESALRELNAADSIGVETGLENVPARRMSLLARLGRYKEGRAIADSLHAAGAFNSAAQNAYAFEGAGWAYTLFLLDGQLARAEELVTMFATAFAPAAAMQPELTAESMAMLFLNGAIRQFFNAPGAVRLTAFEASLAQAASHPAGSVTHRLLPFQAFILVRDTAVSREALFDVVTRGTTALNSAGQTDVAFRTAVAISRDTAGRRAMETLPWYTQQLTQIRAAQAETAKRFRPVRVVVTDSVATFHWAASGTTFEWNRPESMGNPDYLWEATFPIEGGEWEVVADVTQRPGQMLASGSLEALIRLPRPELHQIMSADTTVAHRVASRTAVRLVPETGGFRMELREPRILTALWRERPRTAKMEFRPCGVPSCQSISIEITYP